MVKLPEATTLQSIAAVGATVAAVVQAIAAGIMVRSLRHSARSADAAADALKHAQDTSRRQLRAYLDRAEASFEGFGGDIAHLKIVVKNFGQTPAFAVTRDSIYEVISRTGPAQAAFLAKPAGLANTPTTIVAGADMTYFVGIRKHEWAQHRADLANGAKVVMFRAKISYTDIYGDTHQLTLAYATRGLSTSPDPMNCELILREAD